VPHRRATFISGKQAAIFHVLFVLPFLCGPIAPGELLAKVDVHRDLDRSDREFGWLHERRLHSAKQ
jgi:hypothetical protein